MSKRKVSFIWFLTVIIAYTVIIVFLKNQNYEDSKLHVYQNWKKKYIVDTSDGKIVNTVNDLSHGVVLSESQGYGMLITVLAANKQQDSEKQFYDLYRYYNNHKIKKTNLMSWRYVQGTKNSQNDIMNNATDGDLYIAYALILASETWQNHKDLYENTAQNILKDILKYNTNSATKVLTVGNWANQTSKFYNIVRTSDIIPSFFDKFYVFSNNRAWLDIKKNMVTTLYKSSRQSKSGLVPDFILVSNKGDVRPISYDKNVQLNKHDSDYYYNAFRIPFNLAQSSRRSQEETVVLNKLMSFFNSQQKITSGYTMQGKPLNQYQSASISAPIFYAAATDSKWRNLYRKQQAFILNSTNTSYNYYDDTLRTLVLYSLK